jgi:hypothetical protein
VTDHAPSLHLPPADAASITYRSNLAEVRAFSGLTPPSPASPPRAPATARGLPASYATPLTSHQPHRHHHLPAHATRPVKASFGPARAG